MAARGPYPCCVKVLFATVQGFESDFYGRVGVGLERHGHELSYLTYSRAAARRLTSRGVAAHALADLLPALGRVDVAAERTRIETRYGQTLRDAWSTDPPCQGRPECWCDERAVRHFLAVERLFDELRPDAVVPEVGVELLRTVVHRVALDRGVPTLFLFYTIFPRPLRLCVDSMQAPTVRRDELRALVPEERAEVEAFIADFTARATAIRRHRQAGLTRRRLCRLAAYAVGRLGEDRDNVYLRPGRWLVGHAVEVVRARAARRLYRPLEPGTPFVYFPQHVADDYKIRSIVPHLADQPAIAARLADALPAGHELVVKEHPLSIGRNPLPELRRLLERPNVRLVAPATSSHELIRRSAAVAVIGSTVGLEALLYGKPVLTIGQPFYSGLGVTVDAASVDEAVALLPTVLAFRPEHETVVRFLGAAMRRCYPGAPVLVDDSDENAAALAGGLGDALAHLGARSPR